MPITGTAYIPKVAPGVYQAVCTDCREKAATKDPTNIFRVWEFSLQDGRTVGASSSLSTTPKSKGGKWLAAMRGGRALDIGETFEPIGQRVTIIVALNGDGYEFVETVAAPADGRFDTGRSPVGETVAAYEAPATTSGAVMPPVSDDLPF